MRIRNVLVLMVLYFFLNPLCSAADTLVFKNGDRLSGKFEHVIDRKVIFKSEVAGELSIDIFQLKEINTDDEHLMKIELEDGYTLGDNTYKSEDYAKENTVTNIDKPKTPKEGLSGSISASFSSQHGNTFTEYLAVSTDVTWRKSIHRVILDGYYLHGRDEDEDGKKYTSTDNFFIRGEYDFFFKETNYLYGRVSFKRNTLDNLDYRMIGSAGIGRQWINTKNFKLSIDSGLAYLKEKYSATVLLYDEETDEYYEGEVIDERKEFATQTAIRLNWKIHEKVELTSRLEATTAFQDYSNYVMNSQTEIRLSITKSFFTSLKVIFDYNSKPSHKMKSSDVRYLVGFGWRF